MTDSSQAMARLLEILEDASAMISSDHTLFDDNAFEPTPIAPGGVQDIVQGVFFTAGSPIKSASLAVPSSSVPSNLDNFQAFFFNENTCDVSSDPMGDVLADMPPIQWNGTIGLNVAPALPDLATSFSTVTPSPSPHPHSASSRKSRKYQSGLWQERFQDLMDYQKQHGHVSVPHNFPPNTQLAQWVKRQRYQYRLKIAGHHNTLSDDREQMLTSIGFVWDAHAACWTERFHTLVNFHAENGHCNVPHNHRDPSLSVWVKHQRRQWKRLNNGLSSTMTQERFQMLNSLRFDWNPRNLKK